MPDRNDPTLTVDDLGDLLPCETNAEIDQTLTVGTLQDLYPTRQFQSVRAVEAHLPLASDLAMNADSLDDYFPDKDDAPTYAYEDESDVTMEELRVETLPLETLPVETLSVETLSVKTLPVETVSVATQSAKGRYAESEIYRAAVDFQRFAAKFHVFATECQGGGSRAA